MVGEQKKTDNNSSSSATDTTGSARSISKFSDKVKKESKQEAISNLVIISRVSAKTGISPNNLIEIYPSKSSGKKCDIETMTKDLNSKGGVTIIQQRRRDFEDAKENGGKAFVDKYYPNGIERDSRSSQSDITR
ncbi:MAG: hypothetical protein KGQ36_00275 [Rickettsiales bacterium]|nr:hypothetical protein [Rickettsiales bacterium]